MQKFKHCAVLIALMACTATWGYSQNKNISEKKIQKEFTGPLAKEKIAGASYIKTGKNTSYPAAVKFDAATKIASAEFVPWLKKTLKTNAAVDFKSVKTETDELGFEHQRYVQTFKGVPVEKTMYIVHSKGGNITSFNGKALDLPAQLSAVPSVTESDALAQALKKVGAERYMWEDKFWEGELKQKEGPHATYFPKGELVWYTAEDNTFKLAYRFDILSASPHSEQRVYMDADNGAVLKVVPLEHNCVGTSVNTIFNGNRNIWTDFYNDPNYRLRDDCQAAEVRVRDWNSATTTSNPVEIENSTNTWNNTNNETFGGTVLWEVDKSYQYFVNEHSRMGTDGASGDLECYINAIFSSSGGGTTANNASMNGAGNSMKVGLSSAGTLANSYATVDIIGHEYAHAVTHFSADLFYQDESGALNESFSDIFGEAIERHALGSNDWLMGADRTNGALRDLAVPNNGNQPDTYGSSTFWCDYTDGTLNCTMNDAGGVHTNSGIQNYWFYLLAVGGSGTNDNGDAFNVSAIGFNKAEDIAYRNLTVYLGVNSTFADARDGAIDAAIDLYGACSNEVKQVTNAWYAVGVGSEAFDAEAAVTSDYNGRDISCFGVCDGSATVNITSGAFPDIEWSNGQTTASISGLCAGAYSVTVTNALGLGCSVESSVNIEEPAELTVTANAVSNYNGYNVSCNGGSDGIATAIPSGGTSGFSYDWSNGSVAKSPNGLSAGNYSVTITDANGCTAEDDVTLTEPPLLTTTVEATSDFNGYDVQCFGGSNGVAEAFPAGGVGGYEYLWDDPAAQTTKVATGLMAITYTVTVTDNNNCTVEESVTLTEPPQLTIDAGPNKIVYYGYADSACAKLTYSGAGGGVPGYTITWSTGSTANPITVCPQFTTPYYVTIKDANNCTLKDSVKVCAIDVRCGPGLKNVRLCHLAGGDTGTITLCIDKKGAKAHFTQHHGGDQLAACGTLKVCSFSGPSAKTDEDIYNEIEQSISEGIPYLGAFPNPFTENTTIRFTLPTDEYVTLQVFDVSGKLITRLYEGALRAGDQREVTFDGSLYTNGIYLLSMNTGKGERVMKRIVLAR
ncbi:MAG: M4 family metallopeptidase [Bacteroidota bacterium]